MAVNNNSYTSTYVIDNDAPTESIMHDKSLYFLLFSCLLGSVILLARCLHACTLINKFVSEASMVLVVGIIAGGVASHLASLSHADFNVNDDYYDDTEALVVESLLSFSANTFFMALLPPILFWSGYQLRRELFYRHLKPILLFSAVGTTVSAIVCAVSLYAVNTFLRDWNGFTPSMLELLAFGALIAATDTVSVLAVLQAKKVDPQLFYIVFGESALNDAVALVLFETFSNLLYNTQQQQQEQDDIATLASTIKDFLLHFILIAVGSPVLGILTAFLSALILNYIVDLRQNKTLEMVFYLLTMYFPYMLAECLNLSGIVTIFFSGIFARRYIAPNLSEETRHFGQVLFKTAAYLAEICIFLELGLSAYGLNVTFNWEFTLWALAACLFARACSIYPLTLIYNTYLQCFSNLEEPSDKLAKFADLEDPSFVKANPDLQSRLSLNPVGPRKNKQITSSMAHILWFSGLRGAVAYACVRGFPNLYGHADEFIATTMVIVLFTIIVMGGFVEYMLDWLGIETNVDEDEYMVAWNRDYQLEGRFHDFEHRYLYSLAVRDGSKDSSSHGGTKIEVHHNNMVEMTEQSSNFDYQRQYSNAVSDAASCNSETSTAPTMEDFVLS